MRTGKEFIELMRHLSRTKQTVDVVDRPTLNVGDASYDIPKLDIIGDSSESFSVLTAIGKPKFIKVTDPITEEITIYQRIDK